MRNVKGNKRRWKQLMALLIVAVMLFTTPHIVGLASSMGSEEAATTQSVDQAGAAVQNEEEKAGEVATTEAAQEESQTRSAGESKKEDEPEKASESQTEEAAKEKATTEKKEDSRESGTEAEQSESETAAEEKKTDVKEDTSEGSSEAETESTEESAVRTKRIFRYENNDVKIAVREAEAGAVADNVTLKVTPIEKENKETKKQYTEVRNQLLEKAQNEAYDIAGFLAYDITFVDENGDKAEPDGKVQVSMEYKKRTMPEELNNSKDAEKMDVTVMHLEEDTTGKVKDVVDMSDSKQLKDITTTNKKVVKTVDFETESFSVFTITWKRTNSNSTEFEFTKELNAVKPSNSTYIDLTSNIDTGSITIETEDTNPVLYFSTISSDGLNKKLYRVTEDNKTYRFKGAYIARKTNGSYTLECV